ncbi:unnamed protein product [Paramecium pentaurelia]|uniref:TLDc domain-containing protein n=1 Tax=Paramecium pentaurelia TaxID=43138 RepID=A0A8S1VEZ6_9CILI|nr:unnamed protein product [Paramecium pentaurelia]
MEQQTFDICKQTQNQEKYICLNKECYSQKGLRLHCHECLAKLHNKNEKNLKHIDQFISFEFIANDVLSRNNKKIDLFNQAKINVNQLKKDKFKELSTLKSFTDKSSEYQNQIFKKFDQYAEAVPKEINDQISQLRGGLLLQIGNLQFQIEQYLSNDQIFEDCLKEYLETVKKNFQDEIDYEEQDSLLIKNIDIEEKGKTINYLKGVNIMLNNDQLLKIIAFIIMITLPLLIFLMYQQDYQLQKLQITIQQQSQSIFDLQKLLIQEIQLLRQQQDNQSEFIINQQNETNQANNNIKNILINNNSKLTLKVIQLLNKTKEEFNNTHNLLNEVKQNISKIQLNFETNNQIERFLINQQSEILNQQYIIDNLIVKQQLNFKQGELIYKSKRDGLTMEAFWKSMKKQGSTLLIAKFQNLEIVGAVTIPSFQPLVFGDYWADFTKQSFLFSYTNKRIYKLRDYKHTLYSQYMLGPQFGQGPDLSLQGSTFDQCYSKIGYTYEYYKEKGESIINESSKLIEMEVYLLS